MDIANGPGGGYRYIKGVMQYSQGVAAEPGFSIHRLTMPDWPRMDEGFSRIQAFLDANGLPATAFCACELRSPAPMTDEGFLAFNKVYAATLRDWGIMEGDDNPVARSNVCPEHNPPGEPSFHAVSLVVTDKASRGGDFVVAGSGEAPEGTDSYAANAVSPGGVDAVAMQRKSRYVLETMEKRMGAFGNSWNDCTATQIYTVHGFHHVMAEDPSMVEAGRTGATWHFCRPPLVGLEFEMDCRRVTREAVLSA